MHSRSVRRHPRSKVNSSKRTAEPAKIWLRQISRGLAEIHRSLFRRKRCSLAHIGQQSMAPTRPTRSAAVAICLERIALGNGRLIFALCLLLAIAACAKNEDTKEAHLSRANEYFAAGQYDKA